ncbi:hypothetical protein MPSEU_000786500 [Mayamaea pseudoterrestris]|nr:hypothetical protein MPSEU_000786500 [Mayamaea pseudoterrestris]
MSDQAINRIEDSRCNNVILGQKSTCSSSNAQAAVLTVNPYAVKRTPAAMYNGPLHPFPVTIQPLAAPILQQNPLKNEDDDEINPTVRAAINNHPAAPDGIQEEKSSRPMAQQQGISAKDLPQWQRLPSRHLSFECCEILTIPECAALLRDNQRNHNGKPKSISVTGTIRYIVTHNEKMQALNPMVAVEDDGHALSTRRTVSLVLSDPLVALTNANQVAKTPLAGKQTSHSLSIHRRVSTTPARKPCTATSSSKTPATTTHRQNHTGCTNPTPLQPGTMLRKRSFRSISRTSHRSNLLSSGMGRRTSLAVAMDPMQKLVTELSSHKQTTVWIQADPTVVPAYSFQVGQLLTVMGEVIMNDEDINIAVKQTCANDMEVSKETAGEGDETLQDTVPTTATNAAILPHMAWIRARIFRNATGTNMKQYTDALMMRRKMLEQIR